MDRSTIERWLPRAGILIALLGTYWWEPLAFASVVAELSEGRWQNPAMWFVLTIIVGAITSRCLIWAFKAAAAPASLVGPTLLVLFVSWWAQTDPQRWKAVQTQLEQNAAQVQQVYGGWREGWIRDESIDSSSPGSWWEVEDE